jgi:hypothetical protein
VRFLNRNIARGIASEIAEALSSGAALQERFGRGWLQLYKVKLPIIERKMIAFIVQAA